MYVCTHHVEFCSAGTVYSVKVNLMLFDMRRILEYIILEKN